MELIQWSYTRKYQVKAIFSEFPEMTIIFRSIGSYYFVFTTKGNLRDQYPTRKDYVEMELLINDELQTLPAYIARNASTETTWINSLLLEKGLPSYKIGSPSS
ncbi:hypothetical protein [Paenisporosarcina indica]|uniref:hypothetical protein n=1 Tax=Paenisporosarcina indica TaxID=650093 RepID=UPI00094F7C78|nr:hypothetical protein [Paenisporosarcina indica]